MSRHSAANYSYSLFTISCSTEGGVLSVGIMGILSKNGFELNSVETSNMVLLDLLIM